MKLPIQSVQRKAQEYVDANGRSPFREWLVSIKDVRSQAKITKAIAQMEAGNFGDHKAIVNAPGLYEKRLHYGPGFRIYYITEGDRLIVLLAGSDKSNQKSAIACAKRYLRDFRQQQN